MACTGIQVKALDGSVIFARTLEFGLPLESELTFVPRQQSFQSQLNDGKSGAEWKNRYAYLGASALEQNYMGEGFNEKGLHVGVFYFPGFAEYAQLKSSQQSRAMRPLDVTGWLLGNFDSVDAVVKGLADVDIVETFHKPWGEDFVFPLHWMVQDETGRALVIEPIKGELILHENPVGVFTNAPSFDWHLTNLRNYVNLHADNVKQLNLSDAMTLKPFGEGSGMIGLPGDFTPPSRFVRAAALLHSAIPANNAEEGVSLAWHLINNIDIPKGAARGTVTGTPHYDHTQWVSVSDISNRRFYFRSYEDHNIRYMDLNDLDLDGDRILTTDMDTRGGYQQISFHDQASSQQQAKANVR
jgi:choloylglycine hydrolase